jgi:hypothetical protein
MANDSEESGGSGSASSGQGRQRVRQRTSLSQQASQQAPQQAPLHAPQHAFQQAPQQGPQQNPREAPRHGSPQATQHALQQAPRQAPQRAGASKPDRSQGALAGSARQSTGLARCRESSLSEETRQRSTGSPERLRGDTKRQRTLQSSAGASGAQIRPAGENSGPSSTSLTRELSMKLTLNVVPGLSSSSTPPRASLMGPSAIPSGGSERHHTAAPGTPPPAGTAIGSSLRPSLSSKPQIRPPGPSPGPELAAKSSTGQPPRLMYAAGGPSSVAPPRPMYAAGGPSSGPRPRPTYAAAVRSAGPPDAAAGRKLRLSIETEFYLAPRNNLQHLIDWVRVGRLLVNNYNQQFGAEHPRMRLNKPHLESDNNQMWHVDQGFDNPLPPKMEEDYQLWCKLSLFHLMLKILAGLN